ncbi:helix-turn-helix transcriptional regulator [Caulobacter sp. 1776]|uniref:helix-turn-helix domain-containing protein n=1 Tax=Caulobacter sp. 1776 TaxID=3156420 RepID=UPI003391DFD8
MNTPSPLRKLGGGIRARREAAGWTLAALARAAALDEEALAAIEAGRRDPDYLTLTRLARALGVSVGALLAAMEDGEA